MGDTSKNFNRQEFSCSDQCGFNAVDKELLDVLEQVRDRFGPVHMHCACRCKKENDRVDSEDTSKHMRGLAADFDCPGVNPETIAHWIDDKYSDKYGIGIYRKWNNPGVHLDVRREKARWTDD